MGDLGGRVALRVSFLKAGAELSGPLFVFGHFCTPHIVCPCYMLRGIQLEEMGNSVSPQRISNHWRNPHLKENCQQLNSLLQWVWRKWAMVWSGNEIMLIIFHSTWRAKFKGNYLEFCHSQCVLKLFLFLCHFRILVFKWHKSNKEKIRSVSLREAWRINFNNIKVWKLANNKFPASEDTSQSICNYQVYV